MLLTVRVPGHEVEGDGRVLGVGARERFWLTFQEAAQAAPATGPVTVIRGHAVPLPAWPGVELGRDPVRIDVEGGALYWDAPERVAGPVEVAGVIGTKVDPPDGFPETSGVLRRVRMVWDDYVIGPEGTWQSTGADSRYEEVASSYIPEPEPWAPDPEERARLRRRAQEVYDREVVAGRLLPGESFGLKVPAPHRKLPVGTTETRWTGVLIDLETAGSSLHARTRRAG